MSDFPETIAQTGGAVDYPPSRDLSVQPDYWDGLIDEQAAATFLDLTARTLQGWRYKGGGPRYIRVSARCIRYRRADLREWAEARLRTSTSDQGTEVS